MRFPFFILFIFDRTPIHMLEGSAAVHWRSPTSRYFASPRVNTGHTYIAPTHDDRAPTIRPMTDSERTEMRGIAERLNADWRNHTGKR